LINHIVIFTIF